MKQQINTSKTIHKSLAKQIDLNKAFKIIERKVIKGKYLPIRVKEIQVGNSTSPYFKNIYLYLVQNKLPSSKAALGQTKTQAEKYILFDSLLFSIQKYHEDQIPMLCIPETLVDHILEQYHNSFIGAHQGSLRTFLNN